MEQGLCRLQSARAIERFPKVIPEEVYKAMQGAAVDACKVLRIFDYGRVDMRARCAPELPKEDPKAWKFYIIEVNPNPYLEENAEVAMAARESGLRYVDLLEKILESGERRALRE